ncbi:MAG: radical SAM protein [Actinomycetota bacterium]|nr:radical SAM protein [Actinomycetota bacterium]
MRVAIVYPPLSYRGKYPLLSQNRIFTFTSSEVIRIYPLVLASAATMLAQDGNEVLYKDGINERLTEEEFMRQLKDFNPELIILETKAPVIRKHWQFINNLKKPSTPLSAEQRAESREPRAKELVINSPLRALSSPLTVLIGDHVSFFPEESLENSAVDYVVTGGDYDVSLPKLVQHLEGDGDLPRGVYYRQNGEVKNTGKFELIEDLDSLPLIDRELTKWHIYGEAYLYRPCAYILSGRGCGGVKRPGVCKFCIWQYALWNCKARLRSPQNVVQEIKMLVEKYKVREIFDDNEAGGIWDKEWLKGFHSEMKKHDLIGKVVLSSNARADCLDDETCEILKETGFRLLKIGLESGNDKTLKRLVKDETVEEIVKGVKTAKDHGLVVMVTVMVGYPWETEEDVQRSCEVAQDLMLYKARMGDSLEANIVIPYPGTPLHRDCLKNGWFTIDPGDYEKYGLSRPILKTPVDATKWCKKIWSVHWHPKFILRSLLTCRKRDDIRLAFRGVRSLLGHEKDYTE